MNFDRQAFHSPFSVLHFPFSIRNMLLSFAQINDSSGRHKWAGPTAGTATGTGAGPKCPLTAAAAH